MIHYNLRCSRDHEFDGWFKSSAAFERQAKCGLIECPVCADVKVQRALMAPAVQRKGSWALPHKDADPSVASPAAPEAVQAPELSAPKVAAGPMPDHVRAMLQRLRSEVEKNCDYVGGRFAEEAGKIHRGVSKKRGIYGETTLEQAKALVEEGIEIGAIPWVPRADS